MTWASVIAGGAAIGGSLISANASNKAANTSAAGSQAGINEQRRQFNTVLGLNQPSINTGNAARSLLASLLGIDQPAYSFSLDANGNMIGGTPSGGGASSGSGFSSDLGGMLARKVGVPYPAGGLISKLPDPGGKLLGGLFGGLFGHKKKHAAPVPASPAFTFNQPASSAASGDEIAARLESYPGYKFAVEQARKQALAAGSAMGSAGGNVLSALSADTAGRISMPVFQDYLNRLAGLSGTAQTAAGGVGNAALNTGGNIADLLQNRGDARASGILGQTGSLLGGLEGVLGAYGRYKAGQQPSWGGPGTGPGPYDGPLG